MAKTQEELNALKEEVVTLNEKLHELTEEELAQVTGGALRPQPGDYCYCNCRCGFVGMGTYGGPCPQCGSPLAPPVIG